MTKELAEFIVKVSKASGHKAVINDAFWPPSKGRGQLTYSVTIEDKVTFIGDLLRFMRDNVYDNEELGEMIWGGVEIPSEIGELESEKYKVGEVILH